VSCYYRWADLFCFLLYQFSCKLLCQSLFFCIGWPWLHVAFVAALVGQVVTRFTSSVSLLLKKDVLLPLKIVLGSAPLGFQELAVRPLQIPLSTGIQWYALSILFMVLRLSTCMLLILIGLLPCIWDMKFLHSQKKTDSDGVLIVLRRDDHWVNWTIMIWILIEMKMI